MGRETLQGDFPSLPDNAARLPARCPLPAAMFRARRHPPVAWTAPFQPHNENIPCAAALEIFRLQHRSRAVLRSSVPPFDQNVPYW